ncbi:MAG TPA: hypothetical protein EYP43_02665 [Thermoplasmata archaeon]|nr:hypothetical protein [Thermoplasmata archaeon]
MQESPGTQEVQQTPAQSAPPVQTHPSPAIPDEPPVFLDAIRQANSLSDILHDDLIQPHVYLIALIAFTILVAIVLGVIA